MAYKPNRPDKRSLNEVAGIEFFTDSKGRTWRIRVSTLKLLWDMSDVLCQLILSRCRATIVQFLLFFLCNPRPNWWTYIRRGLHMSDYSERYILNVFPTRDMEKFEDAVIKANLDKPRDQFIKEMTVEAKKKLMAEMTMT